MALGDLVTADDDVEYAGLRLTAELDPANSPMWDSDETITGFGLPTTRDTFQARTGSGEVAGAQDSDARRIEAPGVKVYDLDVLRDLRAAMRPRQTPLEFVFQGLAGPSADKMLVRALPAPSGDDGHGDLAHTDGIWVVDLAWVCPDPRIYSLEVFSAVVDTDGFVSGDAIVNDGDEDAPWSFTVAGPCVNPRLRLAPDYAGNTFYYRGTVDSGDTLSVNSRTGKATIDGASVSGACHGLNRDELADLWLLPPGANDVRFASDSGPSSVTFTWRNCWL